MFLKEFGLTYKVVAGSLEIHLLRVKPAICLLQLFGLPEFPIGGRQLLFRGTSRPKSLV
jgi:hypothetical protein